MGDEGNVRVALRIRPLVAKELVERCGECIRRVDKTQVVMGADKFFTFDHVFDQKSSQVRGFLNLLLDM